MSIVCVLYNICFHSAFGPRVWRSQPVGRPKVAMEFLNTVRVHPYFFYTTGSVRPFPCLF